MAATRPGRAWLTGGPVNLALAADRREEDPESVTNTTRAFLQWRRRQEALRVGDITFVDAGEGLLVFTRRTAGQALLCAFNITDSESNSSRLRARVCRLPDHDRAT
ncbi:MAG: hypothetical protein R3C97_14690 [Geminicoccaceae bacterium]